MLAPDGPFALLLRSCCRRRRNEPPPRTRGAPGTRRGSPVRSWQSRQAAPCPPTRSLRGPVSAADARQQRPCGPSQGRPWRGAGTRKPQAHTIHERGPLECLNSWPSRLQPPWTRPGCCRAALCAPPSSAGSARSSRPASLSRATPAAQFPPAAGYAMARRDGRSIPCARDGAASKHGASLHGDIVMAFIGEDACGQAAMARGAEGLMAPRAGPPPQSMADL